MKSNKTKSDIDQKTLKDDLTLHRILWIQRYKHISFQILLVDEYLIIMGVLSPTNYDKEMSNIGTYIWQKAMKGKLESLCFNIFQVLVEAHERIKPISVNWSKEIKGQMKTLRFMWLGCKQRSSDIHSSLYNLLAQFIRVGLALGSLLCIRTFW